MKIFLSWSGEIGKAYAKALAEWLPLVLQYTKPWMSDRNVEAGARWLNSIVAELENTGFGIVCLTPESLKAPWIMFEAGALAKSVENGRLIPLLLDLDFGDIEQPLAQFQAKKFGKNGVLEVLQSIQQSADTNQKIPKHNLLKLFKKFWPDLKNSVESIPRETPSQVIKRPQGEILEDLVQNVRAQNIKIDTMTMALVDIYSNNQEKGVMGAIKNSFLSKNILPPARRLSARENTIGLIVALKDFLGDKLSGDSDLAYLDKLEEAVAQRDRNCAPSLKRLIQTLAAIAERYTFSNTVGDGQDQGLSELLTDLKITYFDLTGTNAS